MITIAIPRRKSTHGQRLIRYLGNETVEQLSRSMRGWYGPPIALAGVPGNVWATGDGDFVGAIKAGFHCNIWDRLWHRTKQIWRGYSRAQRRSIYLNTGFASLSDLIAEASAGKRHEFQFQKAGTTGVVAVTNSLWRVGNQPAAGAASSAAPGGIAPTDATTGAFPFTNPTGGDTLHWVSGFVTCEDAGNTLLLYDRIFGVAKTMSSTSTESVTGVPTRYQSTTGGAADSAEGNFLFVEIGTALGATAHNWTTCLYTDQSGNGSATLPSLTGNSSGIVNRLDHPTSQWFAPLASGDTGIQQLDQMQCSASVTGAVDFVIGHPIAWMPVPLANIICVHDGINTAFNLTRIFDDAALAFLEVTKPSTSATTYSGSFTAVAG
jgi:hypothetical protein